jgi:hypothetical protein
MAEDLCCAFVICVRCGTQGGDAAGFADDAAATGNLHKWALANKRLETTVVAAATQRTVLGYGNMPDLPGTSGEAAQHDSIDDDSGTDTSADGHDEEVLVIASQTVQAFRDGKRIDIVLHENRELKLPSKRRSQRNLMPSQLGRFDDSAALAVDGARHADSDAEKRDVTSPRNKSAEKSG